MLVINISKYFNRLTGYLHEWKILLNWGFLLRRRPMIVNLLAFLLTSDDLVRSWLAKVDIGIAILVTDD